MNKITSFTGMIPMDAKYTAAMYEATLYPTHKSVLTEAEKTQAETATIEI